MLFRCVNCGGNVVYNPATKKMYCPFCGGADAQETVAVPTVTNCPNCGGEVHVTDVTSASKCEYCGSYLIFDERVNGEFQPHLIMPFKLDKETVKNELKKEFGKKKFAPDDFLSEAKLSTIEGIYVPFWMYDYNSHYEYAGTGTKVRTWTTGNTEYTETSYFNVYRNMDTAFLKIPVDASVAMNDQEMDLLEPFDYNQLEDFQEKYMSGFHAERYNMDADSLSQRAETKVKNDTESLMRNTLTGYATLSPTMQNLQADKTKSDYALLPVWAYQYTYQNQLYPFKINGQTGKIVGNVPISKKKVAAYSGTMFGFILFSGILLNIILGVL